MKTLITLIFCLFVVNTANAEDKWEYAKITISTTKIRLEDFRTRIVLEGNYKGERFSMVIGMNHGEKTENKLDDWRSVNEGFKRFYKTFGVKFPFSLDDLPLKRESRDAFSYLDYFGQHGFELAAVIVSDDDGIVNGKAKFLPKSQSVYILKRKTN